MSQEKRSALYSKYIIDGVKQELSPAQLLDSVSEIRDAASSSADSSQVIVDETAEVGLNPIVFDPQKVDEYLSLLQKTRRKFPVAFASSYTKCVIAGALIDALWKRGDFKLGDLTLDLSWDWEEGPVGNMAAFYESAIAAADYIDSLGLSICSYSYKSAKSCNFGVKLELRSPKADDDILDLPDRSASPVVRRGLAVKDSLDSDASSWLVYIPFDPAEYRFGGSLLSQALGRSGGVSLNVQDADYFMDCFEVVRELAQDGILLSAASVGEGGLMSAVKRMCSKGTGAGIDISDLMQAVGEQDPIRILFAEVPGVLVQIRDIDFDYLDAELLLQDVAFFPLGHPCKGSDEIYVKSSQKTGIQKILDSLIQNQCTEGED